MFHEPVKMSDSRVKSVVIRNFRAQKTQHRNKLEINNVDHGNHLPNSRQWARSDRHSLQVPPVPRDDNIPAHIHASISLHEAQESVGNLLFLGINLGKSTVAIQHIFKYFCENCVNFGISSVL